MIEVIIPSVSSRPSGARLQSCEVRRCGGLASMPVLIIQERWMRHMSVAIRSANTRRQPRAAPAQTSPQPMQSPSPLSRVNSRQQTHPARSHRASLPRFERAHSGKVAIGQGGRAGERAGNQAGGGVGECECGGMGGGKGGAGERVCVRARRRRRAIGRAIGRAPRHVGQRAGWLGVGMRGGGRTDMRPSVQAAMRAGGRAAAGLLSERSGGVLPG